MLLGRDREIRAVLGAVERHRPIAVVGEAGVGKTAVLDDARSKLGLRTYSGGGLAALRDTAYIALSRALRRPLPRGGHASVANLVVRAVAGGLLLLDDLQWADRETIALLPHLCGRLRLICAIRTGDAGSGAALEAARKAGFEIVTLKPLAHGDAKTLIRTANPELSEESARKVVRQAAGNPLMIEELVRQVPSTRLEASLEGILRGMPEAARAAVARVALAGRPLPREAAGEGVEAALDSGALVLRKNRIELRHALIGEFALRTVTDEHRRRLHAELARAVREPGEAARHHFEAGELQEARRQSLRAAELASNAADRASHLGLAARCGSSNDRHEECLNVARKLVDTVQPKAVEELLTGFEDARPEALAEAALLRARSARQLNDGPAAAAAIRAGLDLIGTDPSVTLAELLAEQARLHVWDWDAEQALAVAQEARRVASVVRAAEPETQLNLARARNVAGDPMAYRAFAMAARLARRERRPDLEVEALVGVGGALQTAGRLPECYPWLNAALATARQHRLRRRELLAEALKAQVDLNSRGDYEEAIATLRRVLAEEPALMGHVPRARMNLALALADIGEDEEARLLIERHLEMPSSLDERAMAAWIGAEIEWLAGRSESALTLSLSPPDTPLAPAAKAVAGWAAFDVGEHAPCPVESRLAMMVPFSQECRALQALTAGDWREAEEGLLLAARGHSGKQLRSELRCRWGAAVAAERGGQRQRARALLLPHEQRVAELGLEPLLRRIRQTLRRTGARRSAPRGHVARLTRRELDVLDLVGRGLTSVQTGVRLGITATTVDALARSAMRKLGARSRVHAALLAVPQRPPVEARKGTPLIVCHNSRAAELAAGRLLRAGWTLVDGLVPSAHRWSLAGSRVACTGEIESMDDVAAALLAAARGTALVVSATDHELLTYLVDDLRRLGTVDVHGDAAIDVLEPDQLRILDILAEGASLDDAAAQLGLSRRSLTRRLQRIRGLLGVETNADAVRSALHDRELETIG